MSLPVISTSFSLTTEGAEFLGHQGCNSVVNLAQSLIFLVYLFVLLFVQCKKSSSLANFTHTHTQSEIEHSIYSQEIPPDATFAGVTERLCAAFSSWSYNQLDRYRSLINNLFDGVSLYRPQNYGLYVVG